MRYPDARGFLPSVAAARPAGGGQSASMLEGAVVRFQSYLIVEGPVRDIVPSSIICFTIVASIQRHPQDLLLMEKKRVRFQMVCW